MDCTWMEIELLLIDANGFVQFFCGITAGNLILFVPRSTPSSFGCWQTLYKGLSSSIRPLRIECWLPCHPVLAFPWSFVMSGMAERERAANIEVSDSSRNLRLVGFEMFWAWTWALAVLGRGMPCNSMTPKWFSPFSPSSRRHRRIGKTVTKRDEVKWELLLFIQSVLADGQRDFIRALRMLVWEANRLGPFFFGVQRALNHIV